MKLLVLDPDSKRARFLARALAEEGYAADVCDSPLALTEALKRRTYELLLIDGELADRSSSGLFQQLRKNGYQGPILVITSQDDPVARAGVLDAGANGHIQRPFDVGELMARVFALLRRSLGNTDLRCGELELVRRERSVTMAGKPLVLRGKEYALMFHFLMRAERVVTREELFSQVWNDDTEPSSNIVDVQVSRLRRKLGERAWMLETVRGKGYRLTNQRGSTR